MPDKRASYNVGWMLLRPLICFQVILEHFWIQGDEIHAWQVPFDYMASLSVPIFVFMSFYFCERHITANEPDYLKNRGWRVAWPLVGWALIYFAVLGPLRVVRGRQNVPDITDMFWQVSTGHSANLNPSMWYQTVLLVLTIAFFFIFRKRSMQNVWVFVLLISGAIVLEYTGLNEYLFADLRFELKYPLGRIVEMIPFAVIGYACARFSLLDRLKLNRFVAAFLFLAIGVAALIPLRDDKNFGFGYGNFWYIPAAVGIAVAMWYIPFPRMGRRTSSFLRFASSFTLGIYCVHRLVKEFVKPLVGLVLPGLDSFWLCTLIYIASFAVAWMMSKLPWKWASRLVD